MSNRKQCGICEKPVLASVSASEKDTVAIMPHYHHDERGNLVKCYHVAVSLFANWRFWVGMTFGFPVEHFLWTKVFPFNLMAAWVGL